MLTLYLTNVIRKSWILLTEISNVDKRKTFCASNRKFNDQIIWISALITSTSSTKIIYKLGHTEIWDINDYVAVYLTDHQPT